MTSCLVVDDVEVTRFTTQEILEELGIKPLICSGADEAFRVLKSNNVDVVLLDWHLGQDSGLDFLETVRKEYGPRLPVVVFSGVESESKAGEAVKSGATAFLVKPTTKEKLEGCFRNIGIKVSRAN